MRWQGEQQSENVEDRRGMGGQVMVGGGIGTLFLLPIILTYTAWSYWVFRGKVKAGSGYH